MGKLEASKKPARGQEEARKKPARGQQEASKKPAAPQQDASKKPEASQQDASKRPGMPVRPGSGSARGQEEASRSQQEASKKPGRGPKWGGPHETPKPLKNSYFHEENSPFSRAFPKTDFLEKSSWGSLKPARSQQEASKRPARSQKQASKKPEASQQDASKRPGRCPKWGGPHETPKPLKNSHFHEENSSILRAL